MDLKRLITHFTYRIEPKPEGGFVAHASDPQVAPLEAATREELQQKIQANIAASLAAEFPGLKLPVGNPGLKYSFHIEGKPGGGFAIHSADPNVPSVEGASHNEIANHFVEKLIGFAGKQLMPELARAMAAQGNSAEVKVVMNRTTGFTGAHTFSLGSAIRSNIEDANFGGVSGTTGNASIAPETSSGWIVALFLLLLLLGSVTYFFLHYR